MKLLVSLITLILLSNTNVNENIFYGKWTLCNIECEEQTSYFNVCSEIIFEKENNGYLILQQNKIEFNYYLDKENNQIKIDFKEKQNLINQNTLYYKFNCSNELILHSKDGCDYILNKKYV
ncbi:MAG TPA: hypothetical protein VKZ80_02050 [Flavobacterium sp.]|nr:hypothetical protein [Flavobacterium sp.]